MLRIVSDQNGDYDLVHVSSITRVPQVKNISPTETKQLPPTAKLFFENGVAHSTFLPYQTVRAAWLTIKKAEAHPGDRSDLLDDDHLSS